MEAGEPRSSRHAASSSDETGGDIRPTASERAERITARLSGLNEKLLRSSPIQEKLRLIAEAALELCQGDFARIWVVKPGDLCHAGCMHTGTAEGPHACRRRDRCLHLVASVGRYTHLDGPTHRRVPFGAYKIGRIASEENACFITNDVTTDPHVHDHAWARELGLKSFAGYRLLSAVGAPTGVLALFSRTEIGSEDLDLLRNLASFAAQATQEAAQREELRAKTEELDRLFATSLDLLCLADTAGYFRRLNPEWERTLGYPLSELEGRRFLDFVHPEDLAATLGVIERLAQGVDVVDFVNRYRSRDGSYRWIEWRSASHGDLIYAAARDISERKRADESLRESEASFRELFDSAPVAYHELDRDGVIRRVNRAECALLGYEADRMLGRPVWEFVVEAEREASREAIRRKLSGEQPLKPVERRYIRREGGELNLEVHDILVRNAQGETVGIRTALLDITERKRAEEELRTTEENYRRLIEQADDGIFLLDGDGRFVVVNSAFCNMVGYTREELFELNVLDTYLPGERDLGQRRLNDIRSGSNMRFEGLMRRKDGTSLPVEANARRLDDGRQQAIVRDITERKRAEEERARLQAQLDQAQRLESIGRLAGGVAHDFNNLLTVINGHSQLLLNSMKAGDHPVRESLEEIRRAGERAAGLTQQLLALSRKQVLRPHALDLNRLVAEMQPMLAHLVGEDVELCVELCAGAATICADPHQLEQVIMNLVVNSRDAMSQGGKLSIETAVAEWGESLAQLRPYAEAGPHVVLAVSDTGVGMDEETRQHIFEPFFTTKEVGKGTGLGLSMIQGIVEQSGGFIEVSSEPMCGAVFRVYLPRVEDAAPDEGTPEAILPIGGKETVLVVEDQAEVLKYAAAVLRAYSYRVIEAANAGEALPICGREAEHIDLVLTDVVMPNMSGQELVNQLARLRPGIKVLFMSGYSDDAVARHGVLNEGAEFIAKPFSPEELAEKVRAVLGPTRC